MRKRPMSLAFRLVLYFAVITICSMSLVGWFTERALRQHFEGEDLAELEIIAGNVQQILLSERSRTDASWRERRLMDVLVGHHDATMAIRDGEGRAVFSNHPELDLFAIMARKGVDPMRAEVSDHHYRILRRKMSVSGAKNAENYTILVAVSYDFHAHFLDNFSSTLWLVVTLGMLVIAAIAWVVVWRGLSPLHRIVDRIRHISVNQLQTRIEPDGVPRELVDLVTSFNGMIGRLEDAFQRISNFSADIAHELRTPVTNLMTQTQVALTRARSIEEYREVLYSNMEEFERMSTMINDMLFLSQSDAGLAASSTGWVDLGEEVRSLFEFYEALADESGIKMVLKGEGSVNGDALMLRRAISNLLSNAFKHTPAGGVVTVTIGQGLADQCLVEVCNTGEAISEEQLPRIFDRFYHIKSGVREQTSGAGLGLAIVKSIVEAHKGRVDVSSRNGLTTFRVLLPQ